MPSAVNLGSGRPSLRERVPTPISPFDPVNQRSEYLAWQEGFGAGIKFMGALALAVEEDEEDE